jgi:hypothetical protein
MAACIVGKIKTSGRRRRMGEGGSTHKKMDRKKLKLADEN